MQDPKKADEINLELLYEATHNELAALKIKYERLLAAAKAVQEAENRFQPGGSLLQGFYVHAWGRFHQAIREAESAGIEKEVPDA